MSSRQPWERREDEGDNPFGYFVVYRDMGSARSIRVTAETVGKSEGYLEQVSRKYSWHSRAGAWDDEQDRVRREATLREVEQMGTRHAQIAVSVQAKLAQRLRDLNPDDLKPGDVPRWLEVAVKVERLARGVSTDNIGGHDGGPITGDKTQAEIDAYLLGLDDGYNQGDAETETSRPVGSNGTGPARDQS